MNATPPPPPAEPPPATGTDALSHGLRFALGTLTVLPVRVPRFDRYTARQGMLCAPAAGLVVGLAACLTCWVLLLLETGRLLTAVLTVAVPALLTRALHLDGLADVADGLGSRKPPAEAREVMKRSDIGPFGVLALLFVVLTQIAALDELLGHGRAYALTCVVLAAVNARTALTWACRAQGPPAARAEGLGAVVVRTVPLRQALAVAAVVAFASALAGALAAEGARAAGTVACGCSVVLALNAAELTMWHCHRRFGGINGDVLGAVAETAGTVTLLVLAVAAP
ncbi:adenosylcobinamide-GDP ribazoletransferase [Streptomyces hoynatensis]|uniref:Adenosylcobinamide-GDP ribazoletransferase n=1 Tax=Streptomyces hoynatensis TaxID=1141874 RepID=A0A3A9Z1U5_9ACTN|nr:adenosylcobinamide-GDP ribazoletransferase [Streptomyces hoynatensis]RKN42238.1 adenosylcobinamide-GDP ribazoletransferase [Streptomyces hoynatensis]